MANFQNKKLPVSPVVGVNDNPTYDTAQGVNGTKMILDFNSFVDTVETEFNSSVNEKLNANRTYYVSTTGNNTSNNGLSVGTPFQTINKALEVINGLDFNGFNVTIQLANGTYNEEISLPSLLRGSYWNVALNDYSNMLIILGNPTTPSSVSIQAPYCDLGCNGYFKIKGVTLIRNQYGGSYSASQNALLNFSDVEVNLDGIDNAFLAYRKSFIELGEPLHSNSKIKFIGSFYTGIFSDALSYVLIDGNCNIEFSSANFGNAFLESRDMSLITFNSSASFTGTFVGQSFKGSSGGTITNYTSTNLNTLGTIAGAVS